MADRIVLLIGWKNCVVDRVVADRIVLFILCCGWKKCVVADRIVLLIVLWLIALCC